jgi:hypothetical protein
LSPVHSSTSEWLIIRKLQIDRDATTVLEKYKENFDIPSEGPLSPGTFQVIGSIPIENRSGFYTFVTW